MKTTKNPLPTRLWFWALISCGTVAAAGCGSGLNTDSVSGYVFSWTGTRLLGAPSSSTRGFAIAIDAEGAVYIAGSTGGSLSFGALTLQEGLFFFASEFGFIAKYNASGQPVWKQQIGAENQSLTTESMVASTDGRVYVGGTTLQGLGSSTLTGTKDYWIAQYDSSGNQKWVRQAGVGGVATSGYRLALASDQGAYVAGTTAGALGGTALIGTRDAFVARYDTSGSLLWTRHFGVASRTAEARAMARSGQSLFIAGSTNGGIDGSSSPNSSSNDYFVMRLDASTGAREWVRQSGITAAGIYAEGFEMAIAPDGGSLYINGVAIGSIDGQPALGSAASLTARFKSDGTRSWTRLDGAAGKTTYGGGVATDSSGNVYIAGQTDGDLAGQGVSGTNDAFFARLDPLTGARQWITQIDASGKDISATALATDPSDHLFAVGTTNASLGGSTPVGTLDALITALDSSGARVQ